MTPKLDSLIERLEAQRKRVDDAYAALNRKTEPYDDDAVLNLGVLYHHAAEDFSGEAAEALPTLLAIVNELREALEYIKQRPVYPGYENGREEAIEVLERVNKLAEELG